MGEFSPATVTCRDPDDGSADLRIDLPSDLLKGMNLILGDSLSMELVSGTTLLTPNRDVDTQP